MSNLALRVYLQINFALCFSYWLFSLAEAYLSRGQGRVRFRVLLSWSRALLLVSLLTPPLLSFIPVQHLPVLPRVITQPLEEVSDALLPPLKARLRRPVVPPAAPAMTQANWLKRIASLLSQTQTATQLMFGFLVLLAASSLRAIGNLLSNVSLLFGILSAGVEIKKLKRVLLLASNQITVPFSTRWKRRKWVVFPLAMIASPKDYRIALRHELEHHRQGDTIWAFWLEALVVLFPLNPCLYQWKKKISELQEFSCDEALIGRKRISSHDYASCLVRVAEAALGSRHMPVGTTCMAAGSGHPVYFKSFLRRRIEMFIHHKTARSKYRSSALVGTAVGIFAVGICYGSQQLFNPRSDGDSINPGKPRFDPQVQQIADQALDRAIADHEDAYGFAVVADSASGRILAVANKDNRNRSHSSTHWALSLRSEPASVIKSLTVASAVEQGATEIDEIHNCENGHYVIDGKSFEDWKPFAYLTTRGAVVHSSNICSIKVAEELGGNNLHQALRDFGIGKGGTAANFPEARSGVLPELGQMSDAYYAAAVGVGFSNLYTTPIEIVQAYGAIANGGKLMEPLADEGLEPKVIRRVLSEETARDMRSVLADVMIYGTGSQSQGKIYALAGKTGTAWSLDDHQAGGATQVGSFAGFGPAASPEVVAYVGIQDPTVKPMTGSRVAPVFREIVEKVLQLRHVPPSDEKAK